MIGKWNDNRKWLGSWVMGALLLVVLPMVHTGTLLDPWTLPRLFGLSAVMGCVLWNGALRAPMGLQLPRSLVVLVGVWVLAMCLSMLVAPNMGEGLQLLSLRVVTCLLAAWLAMVMEARKVVVLLAVLGVLQSLLAVGEVMGWVDMASLAEVPIGTTGNPNLLGSLLVVLLPVAGMVALGEERWQLAGGIVGMLVMLLGVWLAGSMAAWLAAGAMGVLLVGLLLVGRRMAGHPGRWSWVLGLVPVVVIVVPLAWALQNWDGTTRVSSEMSSVTERAFLWRETAGMITERPLLGSGPGGWRYAILRRGVVAPSTTFGTRYYTAAHNDFLGHAAESGVVAGVAYAGIWMVLFVLAVGQGLRATDRRARVRGYLMACGVLGWCVVSSFHFVGERMDLLMVVAALGGLILKQAGDGAPVKEGRGRWVEVVLTGICVAVAGMSYSWFTHAQHAALAYEAKHDGNWQMVLKESKLAKSVLYTTDQQSVTPLAWYRGLAQYQLGNYAASKEAFLEAVEVNPWHPHVLNNLASAYVATNQLDSAVYYYEKARAGFVEFPDPYLNLAQIHVARGDSAMAIAVLSSYPEVAGQGRDLCLAALARLR